MSTHAVPRIRPATDADALAIRGLIREAQLNPRDLDWRRFLVAEEAGVVEACAQVRVHGGGTRELASVAVRRDRRGTGIGRAISEATIAREPVRPLYLYAEANNEPFWDRLGFRTVTGTDVPPDLRAALRLARVFMAIGSLILRRRLRLVVMRRDDP